MTATAAGGAAVALTRGGVLTVFDTGGPDMRAKHVCRALDIGVIPKETEGIRAKLKRLVNRQILTETEPGLFTLTPRRGSGAGHRGSSRGRDPYRPTEALLLAGGKIIAVYMPAPQLPDITEPTINRHDTFC
jgi:hypothetical protein